MKRVSILLIIVTSTFSACYYDNAAVLYPGSVNCSGTVPSFSTQVNPLVQSRCALGGCHATGATNTGGALTNFTQISSKALSVKTTVLNGSMPKGSTLTSAEKKLISCWVDNGALNN
jgi:uncharacterized membrane protein